MSEVPDANNRHRLPRSRATLAPLPTWLSLFRLLWPVPRDVASLAETWTRSADERPGWFSKSSWSLAFVAKLRKSLFPDEAPRVWVPAYFCNSALAQLREAQVRFHFYPVNDDLSPDFAAIRADGEAPAPDLFLLVHYFGRPSAAAEATELCRHRGAWLIEDAAHVLLPQKGIGEHGDFVLYSPHKLLAIPDGAVLVVRRNGASKLGEEVVSGLGPPSNWAEQLRSAGATANNRSGFIWFAKRLLQKIGFRAALAPSTFDDTQQPSPTQVAPELSALAKRLLPEAVRYITKAAKSRQHNRVVLDELGTRLDLVPAWRSGANAPYMASYRHNDAKRVFTSLRQSGVPATTWPDLPPEVLVDPVRHAGAIALRNSTVFLPVHQTMRWGDYAPLVRSSSSSIAPAAVSLKWDALDHQQWQQLPGFNSNLLQSWAYGEAKAASSKWRTRRVELLCQGRRVAVSQVLQRGIGSIAILSRINRGPIFVDDVDEATRQACLKELARALGCWWKGRALLWAPQSELGANSVLSLYRSGFRLLSPHGWTSATVDLRASESSLRSDLSGTWRNMLNAAERKVQSVEELTDDASFEQLLLACEDMMRSRGQSFPTSLYRQLRASLERLQTPGLMLAVRRDGDIVAATWAVPHGTSATYLLGWSSAEGRKLSAHHLLLWETMVRLKKRGISDFDLGGIDEDGTGGIAAFKLGIRGARYSLVGEGWVV